ncbi:hypothetical protein HAX54_045976 [Datura stramonium]|uniref:Uncharacterized protein n=1 Tax=Datura stramonium TaxID=4076 RepID=A0ABS8RQ74_DATST|nr:hypothetical protein [Datura stramonium]
MCKDKSGTIILCSNKVPSLDPSLVIIVNESVIAHTSRMIEGDKTEEVVIKVLCEGETLGEINQELIVALRGKKLRKPCSASKRIRSSAVSNAASPLYPNDIVDEERISGIVSESKISARLKDSSSSKLK